MSALVRGLLADAASELTVEGIKVEVSPYHRQASMPGNGVVQLDRIAFPNFTGGVCYWRIVVLLPQKIEAAQKLSEALVPALVEALSPHMTVTDVEFGQTQLDTSGAGQPSLEIIGHREQE